jgi:hypothetical protein
MLRFPQRSILCTVLALGACAVAPPTGPGVIALPAKDKTLADFAQDDVACRQYASQQIGNTSPAEAANESLATSAGVGTVLGAAAGAAIGAAAGNPAAGAAIGGGTGLLFGGAAGTDAAGYSAADLQRRYDMGYLQCMSAKGENVPTVLPYANGPYVYAPYPYYDGSYPYYYGYGPPFWGSTFVAFGVRGHHHHHGHHGHHHH